MKWFDDSKGFGFTPDSGGRGLFAHSSAIQGEGHKSLRENQKVSFDTTTGPKGDRRQMAGAPVPRLSWSRREFSGNAALHPGQRMNLHDFYRGLRDLQVRVAFECLCRRFM